MTFNSIFITDWTNYAAINQVSPSSSRRDKPARFCIQCGLVKPDALVEIASVAHIGTPTMMRLNIAPAPWPGAPVVVLSAGLGGGGGYWLAQRAALEEQYQLVSYDHNGTGENAGSAARRLQPGDDGRGAVAALCKRRGSPASRWWATPWGADWPAAGARSP